jgi:hypothetical protein
LGFILPIAILSGAALSTGGYALWFFNNASSVDETVNNIQINDFKFKDNCNGIYPVNGGFNKLDKDGNEALVTKEGFRLLEGTYDDNTMNSSFTYNDYTTNHIYYEIDSNGQKRCFLKSADTGSIKLTVTGIKYPTNCGATILKLPTKFGFYKDGVLDNNQVYNVSGYDSCPFHPSNIQKSGERPTVKIQNVSLFGYYDNNNLDGNGTTQIETINLPDDTSSLEYIGDRAFGGLTGLKSLDLSKAMNLKFIGQWAFVRNYNLEKVKLPSNIRSDEQANPNSYQRAYRCLGNYLTATDADYDAYYPSGSSKHGQSRFDSNNNVNALDDERDSNKGNEESSRYRKHMLGMFSYCGIKSFDFRDYRNIQYIPQDFLINDLKLETLVISSNINGVSRLGDKDGQAFGFRIDNNRPEEYNKLGGNLRSIYYEGSGQQFKDRNFPSSMLIYDNSVPSRFKKFGAVYDSSLSTFTYDATTSDPYIYCLHRDNNGSKAYQRIKHFNIQTTTSNKVTYPNRVYVYNTNSQTIDYSNSYLPSNWEEVSASNSVTSTLLNVYDTSMTYTYSLDTKPTLGTVVLDGKGGYTYTAGSVKGNDYFIVEAKNGGTKAYLKVSVVIK